MTHRKILCAVDFSELSLLALAEAADLARASGAELVIAHVHPRTARAATDLLVPAEDLIDQEVQHVNAELGRCRAVADLGSQARTVTLVGDPASELVRWARQEGVDLVVIGTHGRTGVRRVVLGSVAERVVRHAHCPVLVVRPGPTTADAELAREVEQYA